MAAWLTTQGVLAGILLEKGRDNLEEAQELYHLASLAISPDNCMVTTTTTTVLLCTTTNLAGALQARGKLLPVGRGKSLRQTLVDGI